MKRPPTPKSMKVFTLIWSGQLVSLLGSGLTGFAMGIWVYQQTGSVTQFALISLCKTLPTILISPLAGTLVDRWDRRWTMILSDLGAGLSTLVIAFLFISGQLAIVHIYLATVVSSTFNAFQWPAYAATTVLLVPEQHLGRASGMTQMGQGITRLVSPMLGGILLLTIELEGVILLDCLTFIVALATLFSVRFPAPLPAADLPVKEQRSLLKETFYGWTYLTARPGLFGLLMFQAGTNFFLGMIQVLVTPLGLSFTSAAVLGTILSIGGGGMLLGSVVMSTWGGPSRRMNTVLGFMLLSGLCVLVAGLAPSIPLVTL
ncbi:MAG: MFS transporter, partial [Phormidesmis sp.]